jgi:N-dimethylarginine dimethylaminohydrolase
MKAQLLALERQVVELEPALRSRFLTLRQALDGAEQAHTAALLAERGLRVYPIATTQVARADGALSCCAILFP